MISDHSYTAVTELFCIKDKQPLLGLFFIIEFINERDPGDDKVQLKRLTDREH